MKSIGNVFYLVYLFFVVRYKNWKEERKVYKKFYGNPYFREIDLLFKKTYRFCNPYRISKIFLKKRGEENIHVYGETPLTCIEKIFKEASLTEEDYFFDLGSGRGRSVFFASTVHRCRSVGIEWIPFFAEKSREIAAKVFFPNPPFFIQKDIVNVDLSPASFIYFYGICLDEEKLLQIIERISTVSKGAKVVTVSFPLTDYSSSFYVEKRFSLDYPWGKADVYINIKT